MSESKWTEIIFPKRSLGALNLKELFKYKDLILLFVKRDFVAYYKQTILGPFWYLLQPIIQTVIYALTFGAVFNVKEGTSIPSFLFFLSGNVMWWYFAQSLVKTSNTFTENAHIFGKVYFPRLTVPVSVLISNMIGFGIQFSLFIVAYLFFIFGKGMDFYPSIKGLLFFPIIILNMAILGLGLGLIISSLTTKYKDFKHFVGFGVQLLMFASPVIFPLQVAESKFGAFAKLIQYNPMTPIIRSFRASFFPDFVFNYEDLLYSGICAVVFFLFGAFLFNKTEQNFMDTV